MSDPRVLDCEQVLRVIFAYLDGELEAMEQAKVAAHLERCRSCFSRAEFERRLKGHMAGLATEPVSPAFEHRIRSLINRLVYPASRENHAPPAVHDA
jgi:anti-sigma factor (TIGR02949 family)